MSPKHHQGWSRKLHFTTQLGKMPLKAQQSTQETSPPPTAPQQLPGGLADHLGMSLYKSGLNCRHSHIALSHDSFPIIPGLLCFLWTASSGNINATSVFQRKKKGIDTYLNYIYACTNTHINPFAVNKKAGLSEGVINALQSSFSLACIISPMNLPLVNIPNLCQ